MLRLLLTIVISILICKFCNCLELAEDVIEDFQLTSNNSNILENYAEPLFIRPHERYTGVQYVHPYWDKFGQFDRSICNVNKKIKREILSYRETIDQIIHKTTYGYMKGETYKHLAHFTDHFGARISGSKELEKAIGFLSRQLLNVKTLNGHVYSEDVELPQWQRGYESLELLLPIKKKMAVKGLGLTIATPLGGTEGEVIVIDSLEDLKNNKNNIAGKILVFNVNFDESHVISLDGAAKGALLGAIAILIRSVTPFSIYSLHASLVIYNEKIKKIPCAAITVEDAELLGRLYKKGKSITVRLVLENTNYVTSTTRSQNILADFEGRDLARDYVVVSAPVDSWDMGHGALSGAGVILTYELARLFDEMKLYPRRTVRTLLFTGSKFGNIGAQTYLDNHEDELEKRYSIVMGADYGCIKYQGYIYTGSIEGACVIAEILQLLEEKLGPLSLIHVNGTVSDASLFSQPTAGIGNSPANIPSMTLNGDDGHYFWYANSDADTVSILDSKQLDICLAIQTSVAYVLADLSEHVPR